MISNPWFTSSHVVILGLQLIFAITHSGGAALRPWAEGRIGARFYRILFALINLPLAGILVIYFFNHRYDGWQLWQVQDVPGISFIVWVLSAPLRDWDYADYSASTNGRTDYLVRRP
jgi:uncharacterized membrane protein